MASKVVLRPGSVVIQNGAGQKIGGGSTFPECINDDSDGTYWRGPSAGTVKIQGGSNEQAKVHVEDLLRPLANVVAVRVRFHAGVGDDQIADHGTLPITLNQTVALILSNDLVCSAQANFVYPLWPGTAFDYTKHDGTIIVSDYMFKQPNGNNWTRAAVNALEIWLAGSNSIPNRLYGTIDGVYVDVLYAVALDPPTNVLPGAGVNVTTDTPVLHANITVPDSGQRIKMQWQLATDSGFTANLRGYTQSDNKLMEKGTAFDTLPAVSPGGAGVLFPGTWFIRARQIDEYGNVSGWSTGHSLTVHHPSTANNLLPSGGGFFDYGSGLVNFSWDFGDTSPSDHQTAYQISAEIAATGVEFYNSSKITSASDNRNVTLGSSLRGQLLRWHVQTWDEGNETGGYTGYKTFIVVDEPTVVITEPADESTIDNGRPNVAWTAVDHTGLGLDHYRVKFRRIPDNVVIYESDLIYDNALTFTPPHNVLKNNTDYSLQVWVTDKGGLTGIGSSTFSTFYIAPTQVFVDVDVTDYEHRGYVQLDWTSAVTDESILSWNVYRKLDTDDDWTLIATFTSEVVRKYKDWLAPSNGNYQYGITQIADRSGSEVESDLDDNTTTHYLANTQYWLINPLNSAVNTVINTVTSDSYTPATDQNSYIIIGRGRRTDYGTYAGVDGSLTGQFRDDIHTTARAKKLAIEKARRDNATYKLKTPFGDIYQVALGDVSVARVAGVALSEYVDVTIPYSEVF